MQSLHDFMPDCKSEPLAGFSPSKRQGLRALAATGMAAVLPTIPVPTRALSPIKVVRVAAASDLQFALPELLVPFQHDSGIHVEFSFGSSGNFARQIMQGLQVDLFMAADEEWVFKVVQAGLTQGGRSGRGAVYALGRLAMVVPVGSPIELDVQLKGLQNQWASVRKFAIANPEHAPYGRAAIQALQTLRVWPLVEPKVVLGESVSQATQFVTSGAAQAGITALSLAQAREVKGTTHHIALPPNLHAPLRQRMVLLKNADPAAKQLYAYLQTDTVKQQLIGMGFDTLKAFMPSKFY
jgi:molybdate transport system substrate-binding protein